MSDDGGGMMIVMVMMMGLSCSCVVSCGAAAYLWYNNHLCEWFGETGPAWICNTASSIQQTGPGVNSGGTSTGSVTAECKAAAKAYCDTRGKKGLQKDLCMKWYYDPKRANNCCVKTCTAIPPA